jgi:hypothetical protein
MGVAEVQAFFPDLALNQKVSAFTQNQALNALIFLYDQVFAHRARLDEQSRARQG